jgi:hypothetical protein
MQISTTQSVCFNKVCSKKRILFKALDKHKGEIRPVPKHHTFKMSGERDIAVHFLDVGTKMPQN